jgi:two-component system, cell cycle response regulator DivK
VSAQVLVIEDNEANLELMTYLLRAFGYATEVARDGLSGLARLRQGGIDLVICDVQLPGLDGLTLAAQARGTAAGRAVPLVAVTAFARAEDRERVLSAGFDGYLSKPIEPETFVDQVAQFLPPALRAAAR